MMGITKDIFGSMKSLFFDPEGASKIGAALENAKKAFGKLENHLKNSDYLVGGHLTIADLFLLNLCQFVEAVEANYFVSMPRLANHSKVIMNIP